MTAAVLAKPVSAIDGTADLAKLKPFVAFGRQADILVGSAQVTEAGRLPSIKSQPGMSANHLQQKAPVNWALDQDASVQDAV